MCAGCDILITMGTATRRASAEAPPAQKAAAKLIGSHLVRTSQCRTLAEGGVQREEILLMLEGTLMAGLRAMRPEERTTTLIAVQHLARVFGSVEHFVARSKLEAEDTDARREAVEHAANPFRDLSMDIVVVELPEEEDEG